MEPADFAVKIEEVMTEECSSYECQLLDDDEIGILWTFLIEDTISGYLGIEDNEDTLKVKTISVGLHLKDITDYSREEVMAILEANGELINANFSVVKFPSREPEEKEPVFVEEGEDLIFDDEDEDEPEMRDLLIIQTRLPFDAFEPKDFSAFVHNLLFQADTMLGSGEDDEDDDDELDEPEDD
ncbi:MAG TPA: hypothetical protein PLM07_17815 [Candidatus Rifleibacterium sp.]|nr:hypothetical protein [Candidatus Rifleibacterium sp.]HPT47739.1 hypothetical protein [Candidatus Rifleibacterium sp.]